MKRIFLSIAMLMLLASVSAQRPNGRQFDPKQFQAHMEQFITQDAALSPQEAEDFFPLFREMQRQMRVLYDQQRRLRNINPADDAGCRENITKCDELDIQIKEIQQRYHKKMLSVIKASKVYKALSAEAKFHRQAFRRMTHHGDRKRD